MTPPAPPRLVAGLALAIALAACSPSSHPARARVSPPPSPPSGSSPSPSSSPAATPTPTPSAAVEGLSMTGSGLAQTVTSAVPARPCGKFGQGFVVDLRFPMLGTTYAISIVIDRYTGPGVYGAPPVRVSAHTLGLSQTPAFYAGVSGTVSVAPNESSGTVDESLLRSPDRYQLTGSWHCG